MNSVTWVQDWGGYLGQVDGKTVAKVQFVGEGWDANTRATRLGVYLTQEMARGAAAGMLWVEQRGY